MLIYINFIVNSLLTQCFLFFLKLLPFLYFIPHEIFIKFTQFFNHDKINCSSMWNFTGLFFCSHFLSHTEQERLYINNVFYSRTVFYINCLSIDCSKTGIELLLLLLYTLIAVTKVFLYIMYSIIKEWSWFWIDEFFKEYLESLTR